MHLIIILKQQNVKILLEQFEKPICTTHSHVTMKLGIESIVDVFTEVYKI